MYRQPSPPSPTFDVPELPAPLRRMKPLPKRRRTSDPTPHDRNDEGGLASPAGATTPGQSHDDGSQEHSDLGPGTPDPAQAAKTVLEAYYMPVLGGVPDLFKHTRAHTSAQDSEGEGGDSRTSTPVSIDLSAALAAGLGYGSLGGFGLGSGAGSGCGGGGAGGAGAGEDGQEDEDGESGDYVDHLQQPGNTKKRKVPANMSGSAHGHDAGSGGSGAEDDGADRDRDRDRDGAAPAGRERDADAVAGGLGGGGLGGGGGGAGTQLQLALAGKKGRLSRATLAGLQHKEMLRSRKRQLAAVIGTLSHGDTLALDQALSANHAFVQAQTRVRLSRRRPARFSRALKAYAQAHAPAEGEGEGEGKENEVPSSDFTFVFHCASEWRVCSRLTL